MSRMITNSRLYINVLTLANFYNQAISWLCLQGLFFHNGSAFLVPA